VNHPNAIRLEAFACGEAAPDVGDHVRECDACRTFVERTQRVAAEAPLVELARLLPLAAPPKPARRVVPLTALFAPLAAAAAAILWANGWTGTGKHAPVDATPSAPTVSEPPAPAAIEPETTFKGSLQVSVIRDRDGAQDRFVEGVRVHPGDRLRIEVALDRPQTIVGAIVGDDGSYLEMMSAEVRSAGTHLSERSARVDARPLHGTILVGAPDAVKRARATGEATGVAKLRVEWEPSP
jgi:hypothetical protein